MANHSIILDRRIPLTSAELVKAMFLCKSNQVDMSREKQEEVSLQWDSMERELHQASFWGFLTNASPAKYQTRIDLILDLIAKKPEKEKEKYFTYFAFDKVREKRSLTRVWREISHTFLILKDWYEDHNLYHKIGYLIASDACKIQTIFALSQNKTKSAFKLCLDEQIQKSVKVNGDFLELSYMESEDYKKIKNILLLFNVESVRLLCGLQRCKEKSGSIGVLF